MSFWNAFRFLINSVIIVALGYTIRDFTHTKKSFPNGKQILTMAANRGSKIIQYTMKQKNHKNIGFAILAGFVAVVLCYKFMKWYDHRYISSTDKKDEISAKSKGSKSTTLIESTALQRSE